METSRFNLLLEEVRRRNEAAKQHSSVSGINALQNALKERKVDNVDLSKAIGVEIPENSENTEEYEEVAKEFITEITTPNSSPLQEINRVDRSGVAKTVILNEKQALFLHKTVEEKEDCILIGAAGTGKTTSMRQTSRALLDSGRLGTLREGTKSLKTSSPGAAIVSFTRKAVNNIRHAVVDELKENTLTIHKLLEFQPTFYQIEDPLNPGLFKTTMQFIPARNRSNPLPSDLLFLAFEEASMISVELYELLQEALPHKHQEVFLGDIQQLPPTFGMAILGFKMLDLPIVELTEVYRQALESPIIDLAWKILDGNPHTFSKELEEFTTPNGKKRKRAPALEKLTVRKEREDGSLLGEVRFQIWQKAIKDDDALLSCGTQFIEWIKSSYYSPDEDVILCPYNKAFGTIELNNRIADYLGTVRGATVHEVIAGFRKHYLAIGDRVLYDKEDATIVSIAHNSEYLGDNPIAASKMLDRWGAYQPERSGESSSLQSHFEKSESEEDADDLILKLVQSEVEDRVKVASHGITIRYSHTDEEQVLETAGEINNLLGGYALTVHKFQGSEAERVFFVLHNSHAKMVSRELLYTAVTRAKSFLHIICEPSSFWSGVTSQRIKGSTLAEKALQFSGARDKMEVEKKEKELREHREEQEFLRKQAEEMNKYQDKKIDRTVPEKSSLDWSKLGGTSPSMGGQRYNPETGKMEFITLEDPTDSMENIFHNKKLPMPDIISDPAEELPEPLEHVPSPPDTTFTELSNNRKAQKLFRHAENYSMGVEKFLTLAERLNRK